MKFIFNNLTKTVIIAEENMFDDVPQDVIIMEHDTDDIKITVFDDTQEGRIILTSTQIRGSVAWVCSLLNQSEPRLSI